MNLYTDFDPKVCAWLAELVRTGALPTGEVRCRDIKEVTPDELQGFLQVHFFAGIGGWPHALSLAGWNGPCWTASLPCQPFSSAGKRLGTDDERHLWPVFRELVAQCRPPTIFGEQVASRAGREWLAGVRADLEALGYRVGAADLCAASVGAPHIRQRLFWVADAELSRPSRFREHGGASAIESSDVLSVARGGGSGGLAYSRHDDGSARSARSFDESESSECKVAGGDCEVVGLADARARGCKQHTKPNGWSEQVGQTVAHRNDAGRRGDSGGLGHPERDGSQGEQQAGAASGSALGTRIARAWGDYIVISCGDGKARRIEPGLAPLVDGVPDRVVRLRGYGNAIVPQVAAAFVRAAAEAMKEPPCKT